MSRSYAKILASLWNQSRKFKSLVGDDDARLVYFYLHTCPHGNNVGCFVLPIGYATEDLGWERDRVLEAIYRLCVSGLIAYNIGENIIQIVDFIVKDAPTNPKHASSMFGAVSDLPDCYEKLQCLNDLRGAKPFKNGVVPTDHIEGFDTLLDRLSKAYRNPTPTPTPLPTPTPPSGSRPLDADQSESGDDDEIEIVVELEPEPKPDPDDEPEEDLLGIPPALIRDDGKRIYTEAFNALWTGWVYHGTPKGPKTDAAEEWEKQVEKPRLDPGTVLRQAAAYCLQCRATDTNTQHVHRWIKKHRWEDDHDLSGIAGTDVETQALKTDAAWNELFGEENDGTVGELGRPEPGEAPDHRALEGPGDAAAGVVRIGSAG